MQLERDAGAWNRARYLRRCIQAARRALGGQALVILGAVAFFAHPLIGIALRLLALVLWIIGRLVTVFFEELPSTARWLRGASLIISLRLAFIATVATITHHV